MEGLPGDRSLGGCADRGFAPQTRRLRRVDRDRARCGIPNEGRVSCDQKNTVLAVFRCIFCLIAAVGFVASYMWQSGRTTYRQQWLRELEVQARLAAALLLVTTELEVGAAAEHFFERLGAADAHRFTLILPDGRVIGDTGTKAGRMESHSDRPEVVEAIAKGRGTSQRYSYSLGQSMLYLALRIPEQGALRAVIRVAVPAQIITRETRAARRVMGGLVAVVLATALVLSYGSARRVIRPVANLRRGLIRIGRGELDYRLPTPSVPHLVDLKVPSIERTACRSISTR